MVLNVRMVTSASTTTFSAFMILTIFIFRFSHPERAGGVHQTVTERLQRHAAEHKRLAPVMSYDGISLNRRPERNAAERTLSFNPSLMRHHSKSPESRAHMPVDRMPSDGPWRLDMPPAVKPSLLTTPSHQPLARFPSAPNQIPATQSPRRASNSDSKLNHLDISADLAALTDEAATPTPTATGNFYIPSTTLWGQFENSVHAPVYSHAPVMPSYSLPPTFSSADSWSIKADKSAPLDDLETKSRFYFHMASVFGEDVVKAVMQSNPNISDPHQLGGMICQLAASKSNNQF